MESSLLPPPSMARQSRSVLAAELLGPRSTNRRAARASRVLHPPQSGTCGTRGLLAGLPPRRFVGVGPLTGTGRAGTGPAPTPERTARQSFERRAPLLSQRSQATSVSAASSPPRLQSTQKPP